MMSLLPKLVHKTLRSSGATDGIVNKQQKALSCYVFSRLVQYNECI